MKSSFGSIANERAGHVFSSANNIRQVKMSAVCESNEQNCKKKNVCGHSIVLAFVCGLVLQVVELKYKVEHINFYIKCSKSNLTTVSEWIKVQGKI